MLIISCSSSTLSPSVKFGDMLKRWLNSAAEVLHWRQAPVVSTACKINFQWSDIASGTWLNSVSQFQTDSAGGDRWEFTEWGRVIKRRSDSFADKEIGLELMASSPAEAPLASSSYPFILLRLWCRTRNYFWSKVTTVKPHLEHIARGPIFYPQSGVIRKMGCIILLKIWKVQHV